MSLLTDNSLTIRIRKVYKLGGFEEKGKIEQSPF